MVNRRSKPTNTQETVSKAVEQAQQYVQELAGKAADNIQQTVSKAAENLQTNVNKMADTFQHNADKAAHDFQHTAEHVSTDATRSAKEARRIAQERAYDLKENASDSLLSAAENLRREAVKSGNKDLIRQAHQLARNMEKAAVYMDSRTFEQMGDDATKVIQHNPWQTLAVAFVIGTAIGLLLNRRD